MGHPLEDSVVVFLEQQGDQQTYAAEKVARAEIEINRKNSGSASWPGKGHSEGHSEVEEG